jgi:protein required for attachment to host cells
MKPAWIVVADASRARIISTSDRGKTLKIEKDLQHPEGRMRDQELVSDQSGRIEKSGRGVLSTMDPPTDPHDQQAIRFAATLATLIDKGAGENAFQSFTLVAPARFLGQLRSALSVSTSKKQHAGVPKDLTKLHMKELQEHLKVIIEQQSALEN